MDETKGGLTGDRDCLGLWGSAPDPGVFRFGRNTLSALIACRGADAPLSFRSGSALGSLSSVDLSSVRLVEVYPETADRCLPAPISGSISSLTEAALS